LPVGVRWQGIATVGSREERLGEIEALFREVNEQIASMTLVEYEALRAEPTRFAVLPGHEVPDVERVLDRRPNYLVVEKVDDDAEEVARESDPRA
jgi:hypothetical protein